MRRVDLHIDEGRCKGCGFCVEFCPVGVLELSDEVGDSGYPHARAADVDRCIGCFNCATICPDAAISIEVYEEERVG
ncbi:MAG TPA: 4Fe-4S dicluster domain-containing protein [Candidatus Latescibacteria bacterium]|nr:4Fe-4S dicluster domain-containing protein [Candidatus Latescibacterota bacterium]